MSTLVEFAGLLISIWLASMFVHSAVAKLADHTSLGPHLVNLLPERAAQAAGNALPWVELVAAAMLLIEPVHRIGGALVAILGVLFASATYTAVRRHMNVPCGCAGGGTETVGLLTVARALTIVLAGTWIAASGVGAVPGPLAALVLLASLSPWAVKQYKHVRHRRSQAALRRQKLQETQRLTEMLGLPAPGPVEPSLPTVEQTPVAG